MRIRVLVGTFMAGLTVAGCGSSAPAAGPAATITITATPPTVTETVTATPAPSQSPIAALASPSSAASAGSPGGAYLAGDLDVVFPDGEAGRVSVVAQGPRKSGAYGTQWPIVIRNNTGKDVCDVKATMSATSGGKLVGSHSIDSITPGVINGGGVGYAPAYFDTQIPDDATVEFTFTTRDAGSSCYGRPAFIDEVNTVDAYGGANLVGKIRAGDAQINGPISVDILCMDGAGQPISGGGNQGFADQEKLAAGQAGTFSVSPGSGPCDQFLVGASGYGY